MIEARELRIGNLIYTEEEDGSMDVSEVIEFKSDLSMYINEGELIGKRQKRTEDYTWVSPSCPKKPIPLTEEWLVRFGFEKIKSHDFGDYEYHKFINGSEYLVWFTDYSISIGGSRAEISKGLCYSSDCIIKYVHQLQNLYFALTGQELELKPVEG